MRRRFFRVVGTALALSGLAVAASAVGSGASDPAASAVVSEVTTPVQFGVVFVGLSLLVLGAAVAGRMGKRGVGRGPRPVQRRRGP